MKLKNKFLIISLVGLIFFAITLLSINLKFDNLEKGKQLEYFEKSVYEEKRGQLKNLIEVSRSIVESVKNSGVDEDEMKARIKEKLEDIRYNDGEGYYAAYELADEDVYMFFHINKSLEGKKLGVDIEDIDGVRYRREIIKNAKLGLETRYNYTNPQTKRLEEKLVYSFYDKDLDLVIFTGFYLGGIESKLLESEEIIIESRNNTTKGFLIAAGILTLFMTGLTVVSSSKITTPIELLSNNIHKLSEGDLSARSRVNTRDELADLSNSFNVLAERLEDSISDREYLIERIDMLLVTTINLFNHQREDEFLSSIFHLIFDFIPNIDCAYGHFTFDDFNQLLFADENRMSKVEYIDKEEHGIDEVEDLKRIFVENPNYNLAVEEVVEGKKIRLDLASKNKNYGFINIYILDESEEFPRNTDKLLRHFDTMVDMFLSFKEINEEILDSYRNFAIKLALVAEAHDTETGKHVLRVGTLARFFAKQLKLEQDQVDKIGNFAPLHDIGKIFIPKELLTKTGALTKEEWDLMKTHTTQANKILGGDEKFEIALNIAKFHHEKWDGSGYPYGLKEQDIPIEASIVSVVDVYDALRSHRPYKRAFTHKEAMDTILNGDGRTSPEHFNPRVLSLFREHEAKVEEMWKNI